MLDKAKTLSNLRRALSRVKPNSDEDEAAFEYMDEIYHVIEAIEKNKTDEQIKEAAAWVSMEYCLARDLV